MTNIIVSTEIDGQYVNVGDLFFVPGAYGTHTVRFTYDRDFIRRGWPIEPSLVLDDAAHELKGLPLALEDASPDAWGQMLLQRAERKAADVDGRDPHTLTPDQVLLAASDATRQGALRFRREQDGAFLGADGAIPTTLDLGALLQAADEVDASPGTDAWEALKQLLDAGSGALGGARPKAAVTDEQGRLWLAKFPREHDGNDVPLWEMVALNVAERAGLVVPQHELVTFADRNVLLVRRFDRGDDGQRYHYMSTRTLMNYRDLGRFADYGTRTGIARRLAGESVMPKQDLRLLWKQAALNLLVNNTDNHLRNHGLLRNEQGWRLAPVFDLDPNPDTGTQFNTHFGTAVQRSSGLQGLLRIASDCGLDPKDARQALGEVFEARAGWDNDARALSAPEAEIALMASAFTGLEENVSKILDRR